MNDSYRIVYSLEARNDLRDIYAYIAQELLEPNTARHQLSCIRKEIGTLGFMPARYALVDWEPWKSLGVHKTSAGSFVIFYIVDQESMVVSIVRILYGGRDIEAIVRQND